MNTPETELELRMVNSAHFNKVLLATIGFVLLFMTVTLFYLGADYLGMPGEPGNHPGKTSADFRLMISLWLLGLSPLTLIPMLYIARRMRLTVNESGIYFSSGLRDGLQILMPDWSVRWDELQEITWQVMPGHYIASRLLFHTNSGKYHIAPWHWIASGAGMDSYFPPKPGTREQASSILENTPLVQWVSRKFSGYRNDSFLEKKKPAFDSGFDGSDVTPATATIAIMFVLMIFLFITEIYFTASEFYAESAPYHLIGMAAVLGFVAAFLTLKYTEPDRSNSLVYAILFGLGVSFAAYPLLIRINTWTDPGSLQRYDYHLDIAYVWRNEDPATPDLHLYLSSSPWWQQFQPGDSYSFELRKGGLDFWQVNMLPVYEAQRNLGK